MQYRTLNACAVCSRQWDVSFLRPGESVRCECGARFTVEFRAPHSPRALRCTSCGANLVENAQSCGYCRAEISLEDRGLSSICPGCWSRLPARAKHCLECGLAIEPQALTALPSTSKCPRCESKLRSRAVEGFSIIECTHCAGLWLSPGVLERLCERADEEDLAARVLAGPPSVAAVGANVVAYLPCAVCTERMMRRNFAGASGVIYDVCREHGLWLDHGELERVLGFVRQGGLDKARQRELERLKDEERRLRDRIDDARKDVVWTESRADWDRGAGLGEALLWLGRALTGRRGSD
ncbi:MAG: zf-TFIIB domain-containing protein [Planctomycetes bacterium]|nr:zf-TFIIB domain-containing protein [Planctomycetota bacterium]